MSEVHRRQVLYSAIGAALLVPGGARAQTAERAGSVAELKGEAFAEAREQRRNLERAAPLFIKDVVSTGEAARLTMLLGTDTRLHVGERARLTIDRFLASAGGDITLQSGPILFDRPSNQSAAPMQIRSSFGLIAVRGTRFFAGPS